MKLIFTRPGLLAAMVALSLGQALAQSPDKPGETSVPTSTPSQSPSQPSPQDPAKVAEPVTVPPTAEDLHGLKVRPSRSQPLSSPFPLDAHTGSQPELKFLSPAEMSERDRGLVLVNENEIARRAELQGLRFDPSESGQGRWEYEQAVCPAFPDHVILAYSRVNDAGDVSLFSAILPRVEGHVRVIPARRRSYSMWTPVSTNSLTLNDFNHMVRETPEGLDADWLTLGLCYSALTGGHVRAALQAKSAAEEKFPLSPPATLVVSGKGDAEVRFSDTTDEVRHMTWVMSFSKNGKLLKVRHGNSRELTERAVKGNAAEVRGRPAKESIIDLGAPPKQP